MGFVKQSLLLLLLAAVGTYATTDDCDGLNRTVSAENIQKIGGDWVLVWAVSDTKNLDMDNITTSHVEFKFLSDNVTVSYIERNFFSHSNSCITYKATLKIPADHQGVDGHDVTDMMENKDGVATTLNESAKVHFFETGENSLVVLYRGNLGVFLLIYRREGHHMDFEKMSESHGDYQKLARCLGLINVDSYHLKEAGDFCHKKSTAETTSKADATQ